MDDFVRGIPLIVLNSEKCMEYLIGNKPKVRKGYRWLYIVAIFIGPFMTVSAVWTIADIFNRLMAFPNLIKRYQKQENNAVRKDWKLCLHFMSKEIQ